MALNTYDDILLAIRDGSIARTKLPDVLSDEAIQMKLLLKHLSDAIEQVQNPDRYSAVLSYSMGFKDGRESLRKQVLEVVNKHFTE